MKKKPPPGATLIARLKEQRLAREAELARRQEAASASEPELAAAVEAVQAPSELAPAAGKEPSKISSKKQSDPDVPVQSAKSAARSAIEPLESAKQSEPSTQIQPAIIVSTKPDRDLIHRQIGIEDLRPSSANYFVLTDEIRLAGRFAAVGLIAQGLRLFRLKDDEIYKEHYQTFEDYCRKEHQMSATYAYRLIRMAEMAEQVARLGHVAVRTDESIMPDPFEVLIGLGHRHLMALLPLEVTATQELLVRGIPVASDDSVERVPLARATERQIKNALRAIAPGAAQTATKVGKKQALVSEKQLIPALSKLVEMLEDWALWLDGDPPEELQAARMGRGPLLNRLAKRFRAANGKIADALEGDNDK